MSSWSWTGYVTAYSSRRCGAHLTGGRGDTNSTVITLTSQSRQYMWHYTSLIA